MLSATRVSATTPLCTLSASCGSTRCAAASLVDWWPLRLSAIDSRPMTLVDVEGIKLDVEATFCYLGDMLCSSGGCDSAVAARCCVAWGKFRKLLPVLTSRLLSPKVCGKVYTACVRSAMLHSSETWGPNTFDLEWLCRNDRAMICWICGTKDQDETPLASLPKKLGINSLRPNDLYMRR